MWGCCKSVCRDGLHLGAEAQLFSMPKWTLQLRVSALLHQMWSTGTLAVSVGIINTAVFDGMIMVYRTPRAREGETTYSSRNVLVKWHVVFLNPGYQNQTSLLTQDRTRNTAKKLPKINQNKTPPPTTKKTNNRGQEAEARSSVRGQAQWVWRRGHHGCPGRSSCWDLQHSAPTGCHKGLRQNAAPRIQLRCAKRFSPQAQHSQRTNHLCWSLPGIRRLHKASIEKDKAFCFVNKMFGWGRICRLLSPFPTALPAPGGRQFSA